MRPETLLSAVPFAPVQTVSEIYRIGFDLAQTAVHRYAAPSARIDESFAPVRRVFEVLASRERERAQRIAAACVAARAHHERSRFGEEPLATADGMLDQRRGLEVPEDFCTRGDVLRFKPAAGDPVTHSNFSLC